LKVRFEKAFRDFDKNPTTRNHEKVVDAWEEFSKISYHPLDQDTEEYLVTVMIRIVKLLGSGWGNNIPSLRRLNVYQDNEDDGCLGEMDMGPHRTPLLDDKKNPVSGCTVSCEEGSTIVMIPPTAMVCAHTMSPHKYTDMCETKPAGEVMGIGTDHTISEMLLALLRKTPTKSFQYVVITLTTYLSDVVNMFERGFIPMLAYDSYCQERWLVA